MPIGAIGRLLNSGGSIFSGIMNSNAATDAAKIQAGAANNATQLQRDIYGQTTQNMAPFLQGGQGAFGALLAKLGITPQGFNDQAPLVSTVQNFAAQSGTPLTNPTPTFSDFYASPGYEFAKQQQIDALQNSAVDDRPQEIVCGVYPKKSDTPEWPVNLEMDRESLMMYGEDNLFSASLAPTGFMRIKRSALERLVRDCPIYQEPGQDGTMQDRYLVFEAGYDHKNGGWRGEDAHLVQKWREMGFRVFVDPDIEFTHRGQKMWRGNFVDHYRAWREAFDAQRLEAAE